MAQGFGCSYCQKDDHTDEQCWCTRPADWKAGDAPALVAFPIFVPGPANKPIADAIDELLGRQAFFS